MKILDRPPVITKPNASKSLPEGASSKKGPTEKPKKRLDYTAAIGAGIGMATLKGLPMGLGTSLAVLGLDKLNTTELLMDKTGLGKLIDKVDDFFGGNKNNNSISNLIVSPEFLAGFISAGLSARNGNTFKESDFNQETANRVIKNDPKFFSKTRTEQDKSLKAILKRVERNQKIAEVFMEKMKSGKYTAPDGNLDKSKLTAEEREYLKTAINNQLK